MAEAAIPFNVADAILDSDSLLNQYVACLLLSIGDCPSVLFAIRDINSIKLTFGSLVTRIDIDRPNDE
jgi:hypothetical protein